ncbi:MAG TPA: DNA adenine methylase [Myxococcota bacterium]|nr:DNA adenine methylase [Myxococcota bacterium]
MVKYIGSKRVLVPRIVGAVSAFRGARTVLDLFSGTSRVGHALKRAGFRVLANDHNAYAHALARCYVQADRRRVWDEGQRLIREFAGLPPRPGYFTETFCVRARFFHPRNGARIDAIREAIAGGSFEPNLEAVLLTALMEAADRVDSTTGVQMAYLKTWAPRALHELELRMPDVLPGEGKAFCLDAVEAARALEADVAYLDPPYNQHSYLGNYHVWETLVRWDKPEAYGVACKRVGCKTYRSDFNSRRRIHAALGALVDAVRAPHLVVSFNDEGYVSRAQMEALLSRRGHVEVVEIDFPRYVGARIGIFNPSGIKVGTVGRLRNKERLFIVSEERACARAAAER